MLRKEWKDKLGVAPSGPHWQVRVSQDLKKWQDSSAILHLCTVDKRHRDQWVTALTAAMEGTPYERCPVPPPLRLANRDYEPIALAGI